MAKSWVTARARTLLAGTGLFVAGLAGCHGPSKTTDPPPPKYNTTVTTSPPPGAGAGNGSTAMIPGATPNSMTGPKTLTPLATQTTNPTTFQNTTPLTPRSSIITPSATTGMTPMNPINGSTPPSNLGASAGQMGNPGAMQPSPGIISSSNRLGAVPNMNVPPMSAGQTASVPPPNQLPLSSAWNNPPASSGMSPGMAGRGPMMPPDTDPGSSVPPPLPVNSVQQTGYPVPGSSNPPPIVPVVPQGNRGY